MTSESRKAFEGWADSSGYERVKLDRHEDSFCTAMRFAASEGWQASCERIRAKLQSEEVVEIALKGFEARYDKNYARDTNADYLRAAIAAILEEI